jgi:hypothetical protein
MSARPPRQFRAKRRIFLSILGEALSSEDLRIAASAARRA